MQTIALPVVQCITQREKEIIPVFKCALKFGLSYFDLIKS